MLQSTLLTLISYLVKVIVKLHYLVFYLFIYFIVLPLCGEIKIIIKQQSSKIASVFLEDILT